MPDERQYSWNWMIGGDYSTVQQWLDAACETSVVRGVKTVLAAKPFNIPKCCDAVDRQFELDVLRII